MAKVKAAALRAKASLTTSRGCTDAPSIVPRNSSTVFDQAVPLIQEKDRKHLVFEGSKF
jgi:hypothetical protein